MPAGSEPLRPGAGAHLPRTMRPLATRMAGLVAGFGLLALCIGAWIALGPDIRSRFTLPERITLVLLGCLGAAVWLAVIRARLELSDLGLVVVNGYKRRELVWAQVVGVRLRVGAPWAEMDLSDGTTIPVMAIQGSDGDRAVHAVRDVRRELAARSPSD